MLSWTFISDCYQFLARHGYSMTVSEYNGIQIQKARDRNAANWECKDQGIILDEHIRALSDSYFARCDYESFSKLP